MALKYFDGILKAQRELGINSTVLPFDRKRLGVWETLRTLLNAVLYAPALAMVRSPAGLRFARRFCPRLRLWGGVVLLTRDSDVREVLDRPADFPTPYGLEMAEFAGGKNFILGMWEGAEYSTMKSHIVSAFPRSEVVTKVRPIVAARSRAIVEAAGGELNVARDLLRLVPVAVVRDYYGVLVVDDDQFAEWNLALSQLFFGDPFGSKVVRELAMEAGRQVRATLDRSIDAISKCGQYQDRPLDRLVKLFHNGTIGRDDVHSIMMGMITGFTPTNLLAAGNCLDVVLSRPEMFATIKHAVVSGDDTLLDNAIVEAMRFEPIFPGPWRYAAQAQIIGARSGRPYRIKANTVVMPATRSAMFDEAAVGDADIFRPERSNLASMVFGYGMHRCIGEHLARVQIAETFKALFLRPGLRRAKGKAGKLKRLGPYPDRLIVAFDDDVTKHSMVTVVAPVRSGVKAQEIEAVLAERLGNPAKDPVVSALRDCGIIHFASVSAFDPPEGRPASTHIVIEITGDGDDTTVIRAFARALKPELGPIVEQYCTDPNRDDLDKFLTSIAKPVSPDFGSVNGLVFDGTPGHSVKRILQEEELAQFAMSIVTKHSAQPDKSPADVLREVQSELRKPAVARQWAWAFIPVTNGLDGSEGKFRNAVWRTLRAPGVWLPLLLVWAVCCGLTYSALFPPTTDLVRVVLRSGTALVLSGLGILAIVGLMLGAAVLRLRRLEKEAKASDHVVGGDALEKIQQREDISDYQQNHLTAVSEMHPKWFRRLTLRIAFYAISIAATHVFKPGYLSTIGSIHFARWVYVPASRQLLFLSNYGGSWESYLEDFITKAAKGLTGVWSNAKGFPRSRFLFFFGARDGDRFKRWARTQQRPTAFWYSAYPNLTTSYIRTNALIRKGIRSAADGEASEWLSLFSSMPRQSNRVPNLVQRVFTPDEIPHEPLEASEIQSITFGPFGGLPDARMLTFQFPDRAQCKAWLDYVSNRISFGDNSSGATAMMAAFDVHGLMRLGLPASDAACRFPSSFVQGMANKYRSRILDDIEESDPKKWEWGSGERGAQAIVICYGDHKNHPVDFDAQINDLKTHSERYGVKWLTELDLRIERDERKKPGLDAPPPPAREHFGFADGISQPVIRGSRRSVDTSVPAMHLIQPGEFLFGYRDEHGFYPPTPVVRAVDDPDGILRTINAEGQVIDRAKASNDDHRDFGRNGTFMVVRQLEQHVDAFNTYCNKTAVELARSTGKPINDEWVGARIVGRWKNGSSLTRNPDKPGREADNHFTFGTEDQQGQGCPFGAHVRRSNPRDSLSTDHETQIRISKRHRILRCGRTYKKGDDGEKGLLFMCVNASIERQYEFVQQTWMASTSFQGLRGEKDPLIASNGGFDNIPPRGQLSVPLWNGPVQMKQIPSFVTTRGGGYFFLPSRSALRYLVTRAVDSPTPVAEPVELAKPVKRKAPDAAKLPEPAE